MVRGALGVAGRVPCIKCRPSTRPALDRYAKAQDGPKNLHHMVFGPRNLKKQISVLRALGLLGVSHGIVGSSGPSWSGSA